jgi:hypothetical protein
MAELEYISPEEARTRLLVAYQAAGDGDFVETLRRPFTSPIDQRNELGKRKPHPLLVVGLVLLALAGVSMALFSFMG